MGRRQTQRDAAREHEDICDVPLADDDHEDIVPNARRQLQRPASSAMRVLRHSWPHRVRMRRELTQKALGDPKRFKNTDVHLKQNVTTHLNSHQDHIAERGYHSTCRCGLVHTPIPVLNAMNIPAVQAETGKDCDKL